jgi:hypothetical protein
MSVPQTTSNAAFAVPNSESHGWTAANVDVLLFDVDLLTIE